jgi:preprotein translocase subunit YajC
MQWSLLAQDTAPPPQDTGPRPACGGPELLMMMAIMLIFWFLLIRPQQKAEKVRRAKLAAIQKGDRVRTRGGILGTVTRVTDDQVTVRVDGDGKGQVHLPVAKAYIDDVETEGPSNEPGAK